MSEQSNTMHRVVDESGSVSRIHSTGVGGTVTQNKITHRVVFFPFTISSAQPNAPL